MSAPEDVKHVVVEKKGGGGFVFSPNQREDQTWKGGEFSTPVHQAPETVKVEAQEIRERVRKAGLLP